MMEEIVITRLWMAGVMGVMIIFAIIALYGYLKQDRSENKNNHEN